MLMTANPCADAERHFDEIEAAGEAHDAQQAAEARRLSAAFIDAAAWGADEPLEGADVAEALYEVAQEKPALIDAFFYWAASQEGNPALRAMVDEVAQAWAEIKLREAA